MKEKKAFYGIHIDGREATQPESMDMQFFDVLRLARSLQEKGRLLVEDMTTEQRHHFDRLMKRSIVTSHGDPAEEWKEIRCHLDEQKQVLQEFLENPEGYANFKLFSEHMAPLFRAGINEVGLPIETCEGGLEKYYPIFIEAVEEYMGSVNMQQNPMSFSEALQAFHSSVHKEITDTRSECLYVLGEVHADMSDNTLVDALITPSGFITHRSSEYSKAI